MSVSRRHLLLGSSSALFLTACGGGGGSDTTPPTPTPTQKIEWDVLSRGPETSVLAGVTYAKSLLVARGSNGIGANRNRSRAMSYSENGGASWTAVEITDIGDFATIQGVAFGKGRWVAVTSLGDVITSTTGKTWSVAARFLDADDSSYDLWSVTFGNGAFMIMGGSLADEAFTWASEDGLSWSDPRPVGFLFTPILTRRVFVDGSFYHLGEYNVGVAEGDGAVWTALQFTVDNMVVVVKALAWGNGQWVAVTDQGFVATSPDFTTWTVVLELSNPRAAPFNVSFVNGGFVLLVAERIYTSTDGSEWVESVVGTSGDSFYDVVFDGTRYVVTGGPGLTATGTLV